MSKTRRRRRNTGVVDDIATLFSTIVGGSTAFGAFYDYRRNVASSAGVVDTLDDARGGGFGPQLVGTTTKRPQLLADGILGDGVDDTLISASIAMFDLSNACSIFFVGTSPASSGLGVCGIGPGPSLWISTNTGPVYAGQFDNATTLTINTAVAPSPAITRLILVGKDAGAGVNRTARVPNIAEVLNATGTANTAGNRQFEVLTVSGGAAPSTSKMKACGFMTRRFTIADGDALMSWAQSIHSATPS